MKAGVRIDCLLTERGLAESREKAQAMIMAGDVLVNDQKVVKAGQRVPAEARIRVLGGDLGYVSRGGIKLAAALDQFAIDVEGAVCLDIGASTGGFTDCLLQRGAGKVYAVDVGRGQLHWKVRQDPRVAVRERVNARYLSSDIVPEAVGFFCCDVSFISVTLIVPAAAGLLKPGAEAVVLVKPQFEAGKGEVGKGGIVRDPALHDKAVEKVRSAMGSAGFDRLQHMESPILGAAGNKEFLLYAVKREAK